MATNASTKKRGGGRKASSASGGETLNNVATSQASGGETTRWGGPPTNLNGNELRGISGGIPRAVRELMTACIRLQIPMTDEIRQQFQAWQPIGRGRTQAATSTTGTQQATGSGRGGKSRGTQQSALSST